MPLFGQIPKALKLLQVPGNIRSCVNWDYPADLVRLAQAAT